MLAEFAVATCTKVALVSATRLGQSKPVPVSHRKKNNHTTVSRRRHCDSEVVIRSTNGHLLLITRLLSLSKIRALLRGFYTMRYNMMLKGGYNCEKYAVALPYKEGDDT